MDFLSVINSLLVMIDYQSHIFDSIESGDKSRMKSAAVASAKAASMLRVPVLYTLMEGSGCGEFFPELLAVFPDNMVYNRAKNTFDALEDKSLFNAISNSGRYKIIFSGIPTAGTLAPTALHAVSEGFDVYCLIDSCGDSTRESHQNGVKTMLSAGVTPLNWQSLTSEWLNDSRTNSKPGEMSKEAYIKYNVILSLILKE